MSKIYLKSKFSVLLDVGEREFKQFGAQMEAMGLDPVFDHAPLEFSAPPRAAPGQQSYQQMPTQQSYGSDANVQHGASSSSYQPMPTIQEGPASIIISETFNL